MLENLPDVLTISDLQKTLGIGRNMAYRLICEGHICHIRIGKNIRIPRRYLVDYIESVCYYDKVTTELSSEEAK